MRDRDLVRLHWPPELRAAFDALFALDDALGEAAAASQPALGAIKLAWWRDSLAALDHAPPPAEPRLQAASEQLIPRGITAGELAALEEGWRRLLEPTPDVASLDQHGGRLFALAARLIEGEWSGLAGAGALFARRRARAQGFAIEDALPMQRPVPRKLRPLTALAVLAERDPGEPEATPGRAWALVRHRLTGR